MPMKVKDRAPVVPRARKRAKKLLNAVTLKTLRDSEAGRGLIVCENADDMFKKLGI